jgi:hypothetical protein
MLLYTTRGIAAEVAVVGSSPGGSTPCATVIDPPGTGFCAKAVEVKKIVVKQIPKINKSLLIGSSS